MRALAALPDRDVDLAEAALWIAAEEYPELDVREYLARLESLAAGASRRYTAITIIGLAGEPDRVQRAIDLSREKYCSVWHTMRQDVELKVRYEISD